MESHSLYVRDFNQDSVVFALWSKIKTTMKEMVWKYGRKGKEGILWGFHFNLFLSLNFCWVFTALVRKAKNKTLWKM